MNLRERILSVIRWPLSRWGNPAARRRSDLALIDRLAAQISTPGRAKSVRNSITRFRALSAPERKSELAAIYLLLERYLTEVDPYPSTVEELRNLVRTHHADLLDCKKFRIIFEPPERQQVLLGKAFLEAVIERAYRILGKGGDSVLTSLQEWVASVPLSNAEAVPFVKDVTTLETDADWFTLLARVSHELYQHLESRVGEASDRMFGTGFEQITNSFGQLESFPEIIRMLPEQLLDESKMRLLSHRRQLLDRDREVEAAHDALEAAEEKALRSSAQLQVVLATVGEGIVTVDDTGTIRLINREAESIWGYGHGYLLGRNVAALTGEHFRLQDFLSKRAVDSQSQAASGWSLEVMGLRKDGTQFPLELRLTETRIGDATMYTAAARDITDRRRYEEGLIQAKERAEEMVRLKASFLANMSHEIRTPLTGIIGFAAVIAEVIDDEYLECAQLITKSGERLLYTLNSILDLANFESGEYEIKAQLLDIAEEARSVLASFEDIADEKGLELTLEVADEPIAAITDPTGLRRVLHHLVGNAIKFTERGGVSVSLDADRHNFYIRVQDTGIGIGDNFLPDIFSEFKQESIGLQREFEGSGLGLTITKRIVESLGGSILVESERGKGSVFTVLLPRRYTPANEIEKSPTARLSARPTRELQHD